MNLSVSCFKLNATTSVQNHAGHRWRDHHKPTATQDRSWKHEYVWVLLSYKMSIPLKCSPLHYHSVKKRERVRKKKRKIYCNQKENHRIRADCDFKGWVYNELTFFEGLELIKACKCLQDIAFLMLGGCFII